MAVLTFFIGTIEQGMSKSGTRDDFNAINLRPFVEGSVYFSSETYL